MEVARHLVCQCLNRHHYRLMILPRHSTQVERQLAEVRHNIHLVAAFDHVRADGWLAEHVTFVEWKGICFQTWNQSRHVAHGVDPQPGHRTMAGSTERANFDPEYALFADEEVEIAGFG